MKGSAQKREILAFLEPANDTAEPCAAISGRLAQLRHFSGPLVQSPEEGT